MIRPHILTVIYSLATSVLLTSKPSTGRASTLECFCQYERHGVPLKTVLRHELVVIPELRPKLPTWNKEVDLGADRRHPAVWKELLRHRLVSSAGRDPLLVITNDTAIKRLDDLFADAPFQRPSLPGCYARVGGVAVLAIAELKPVQRRDRPSLCLVGCQVTPKVSSGDQ